MYEEIRSLILQLEGGLQALEDKLSRLQNLSGLSITEATSIRDGLVGLVAKLSQLAQ